MTPSSVGVRDTVRTAPRLLRILRTLARHGFVGAVRGKRHWPSPAQVRETLEELGVVFLKFGQVLALRRDLLPDVYVAELERLHDRLPPVDFAAVRETVERELGGPLEQLFGSFDPVPLAAATIAQVHAATLADGRPVVVKVRRADLARLVARPRPSRRAPATTKNSLSKDLAWQHRGARPALPNHGQNRKASRS